MALRTALFRAAPERKAKRKKAAGARPKGGAERAPGSVTKDAPGPKRGPRLAAKPGAGPRATPKSRPRRTPRRRPPLLQRGTLGSLLARAALLAVAVIAMTGFAVALARVTLVPSPSSDALVHTNLRPGASIRAYLDQPTVRDSVKQIGGNILLGVPFGVLLPVLFPRARGLVRTAAVTALVMVLVESAQGAIVEGRAFDIDDVILNTLGAFLGYLLVGRRLGHAFHPRRATWWHRLRKGRLRERA
jgi:VanZ like protein